MKKVLVILVCLFVVQFAFSGQFSLGTRISPYSIQNVTIGNQKFTSDYGFEVKALLDYNILDNLDVGASFNFSGFNYDEISSSYKILGFRLMAGYSYFFNENIFARGELALGLDLRQIEEFGNPYFGSDLYLGLGYKISEKIAVGLGSEFGFAFQSGKENKSSDFLIKPGFSLTFFI